MEELTDHGDKEGLRRWVVKYEADGADAWVHGVEMNPTITSSLFRWGVAGNTPGQYNSYSMTLYGCYTVVGVVIKRSPCQEKVGKLIGSDRTSILSNPRQGCAALLARL